MHKAVDPEIANRSESNVCETRRRFSGYVTNGGRE